MFDASRDMPSNTSTPLQGGVVPGAKKVISHVADHAFESDTLFREEKHLCSFVHKGSVCIIFKIIMNMNRDALVFGSTKQTRYLAQRCPDCASGTYQAVRHRWLGIINGHRRSYYIFITHPIAGLKCAFGGALRRVGGSRSLRRALVSTGE